MQGHQLKFLAQLRWGVLPKGEESSDGWHGCGRDALSRGVGQCRADLSTQRGLDRLVSEIPAPPRFSDSKQSLAWTQGTAQGTPADSSPPVLLCLVISGHLLS